MDSCSINYISLYSGAGGLDLGFKSALPAARAVCYVERDAEACALLVDHMQAGMLDDAPVWTDSGTFDGSAWRGAVDFIIGGFPCQPWSVAGRQQGTADERWLWPHIARIIDETGAGACYLENVPGLTQGTPYSAVCIDCRVNYRAAGGTAKAKIINDPGSRCDVCQRALLRPTRFVIPNAGLTAVLEDLAERGFAAEWTAVRASDVGATHRRERVFILAYNDSPKRWARADDRNGPADPEEARRVKSASDVEDPGRTLGHAGHDAGSAEQGQQQDKHHRRAGEPGASLADTRHEHARSGSKPGQPEFTDAGKGGSDLVNTSSERRQGPHSDSSPPGRIQQESGDRRPGVADAISERRRSRYAEGEHADDAFPPGPNDDWSNVDRRYWPAVESEVRNVVNGLAGGLARTAQLRLAGNGVVPQQAAAALIELLERMER